MRSWRAADDEWDELPEGLDRTRRPWPASRVVYWCLIAALCAWANFLAWAYKVPVFAIAGPVVLAGTAGVIKGYSDWG